MRCRVSSPWRANPERLVDECILNEVSSAAHETLSWYGILHGDISAGNILIDVDVSYKPEAATATEPEGIVIKDRDPQNASGFLSDWGVAWFPRDVLEVATSVRRIDSRPLEPDSGDMPVVSIHFCSLMFSRH